ncbi:FKBP-type peptidyl-prolyl cis-trans isomerase [Agromyces ramosus]|uniref:Peptidyl-prolyl cis-trans isomerase n=1 Tax=Agromyces ramosus TaxID=33879 RepID=A0ABU0RDC0_9MICO|nr:FKBP-type peptidyl-prolyl cis-trans isomerase [Agromyces ramosus]MDQ0896076.1 FKBP-type peptidyl-prolyl cis-trans isomerase [Agromyces ramosus]
MRSSLALIASAGLVAVVLSGCAAAPAPEAGAGRSSEAVVVKGDFGEAPRVEFPSPLAPEETQCTEIIAGEGELLVEGQQALVGLAVYNGTSGEELQVAGFKKDPVPLAVTAGTLPGLRKGLTCAREGSRVAVVVPAEDAFGDEGNTPLGIEPGDSLVFVLDVQRTFPSRAEGAVRLSRDGFPAVVLAPDGRPGITVPKSDPPEHVEVELLKEGAGPVVEDGDRVVVHYTGVLWDDNTVFDSSWETAEEGNQQPGPRILAVSTGEGAKVIPGFADALIGQTVGSQVGVIVPPSEGYGDQGNAQVPANSTLFFVIDILGVV